LKKAAIIDKKNTKHVLIRLLSFPIAVCVVYLFIHNLIGIEGKGWGHALFAAASIVSLVLTAEIILFFTKKKMSEIYYNIGLIFLIFIFAIIMVPLLN